ncbi:MAG: glycosyltransferase [Candidatus Bathyarchaeia archaeon]
MKKLLLISYESPPLLSAPSDRIYGFMKYLPAYDWEPFLLTVKNPFPYFGHSRLDAELYRPFDTHHVCRAVDLQFEVVYFGLKKLGVDPRIFLAFDETLGWIPHAYLLGRKLIEREQIDCILASYSPPSSLIIGAMLSRRYGVPLILDYRDPWNSIVAHPSALHKKLEMSLENAVLTCSDGIVTVGDGVRDMLFDDFPIAKRKRAEIVRNGFLLDILDAKPCTFADHKIHILHAGSLYRDRVGHMLRFLEALTILSKEIGTLSDKFEVILTGFVPIEIADQVRKSNLDSIVRIIGHMPRREVWSYMKGVEYLLCIPGWNQTLTWKIYEYLAAGKPIINVGEEDGEAARLIAKYDVGATVRPDPVQIKNLLKGLLRFPLAIKRLNDIRSFSREKQTEKLAIFMDEIVKGSKRRVQ